MWFPDWIDLCNHIKHVEAAINLINIFYNSFQSFLRCVQIENSECVVPHAGYVTWRIPEEDSPCLEEWSALVLSLFIIGIFSSPGNDILVYLWLADTYKSIMIQKELISKPCRPFVLPLLCYTQFPYCAEKRDKSPDPSRLVQLCRSDCLKLQNDICRQEYVAAKADLFFSKELLPDCSQLPRTDCIRIYSKEAPVDPKGPFPMITCELYSVLFYCAVVLLLNDCAMRPLLTKTHAHTSTSIVLY